jgi:hypothetical protein
LVGREFMRMGRWMMNQSIKIHAQQHHLMTLFWIVYWSSVTIRKCLKNQEFWKLLDECSHSVKENTICINFWETHSDSSKIFPDDLYTIFLFGFSIIPLIGLLVYVIKWVWFFSYFLFVHLFLPWHVLFPDLSWLWQSLFLTCE